MDISSLFKDPKLRVIILILGGIILLGGVGYYYYANFIAVPIAEEPVRPKINVTPVPSLTDTLTQILSTLTFKETIFTYPQVALGRSNPFVPVIQIPQGGVTPTPQETIRTQPPRETTTVKVKTQEKSFASDFRVTGIIKYGNSLYAIIEEKNGEYNRGYVAKEEGQKIRDDIYVSKITQDSVILKKGKEFVTLKLGGE